MLITVVSYNLHWVAETGRWTLTQEVADANGMESSTLAEHHEVHLSQKWLAPKEWAADIIGCDARDFIGVIDDYYRSRPVAWHVTKVLNNA